MAKRVQLNPPGWEWTTKYKIAAGIQVEDTVYISGIISLDPAGNIVGEGDMAAQSHQVFKNIQAILAEAGATFDDIVKITTFVTDIGLYREYAAVRAEYFTNNISASTAVSVPALVMPELLVEVEAVAVVGSG